MHYDNNLGECVLEEYGLFKVSVKWHWQSLFCDAFMRNVDQFDFIHWECIEL